MGIEDEFYATIKLNSGEEIFAKIAASEETDRTMVIVHHPIVIEEIKARHGHLVGYKVEPWLKTSKEDMFIINLNNILTLSESQDIEMIMMYQRYVRDSEDDKTPKTKISRKMGYVANVKDAKEILEKIYKNNNTKSSPDQP